MPEEQTVRMTTAGWIFLTASWTGITVLVSYCLSRILKSGEHVEPDETTMT